MLGVSIVSSVDCYECWLLAVLIFNIVDY